MRYQYEYGLAIQHYEQLKKIFLQQISTYLSQSVAQQLLDETGIENSLLTKAIGYENTGNLNNTQIDKVLNEIFNKFGELLNNDFNTTQFIQYSKQQINEEWKFIQEKLNETQKEQAIKMQKYVQSLGENGIKNFLILAIQQNSTIQNATIDTRARFQSLIDRANTFARIWAESTILNGPKSYELYQGSALLRQLGGYIREDLALQGLLNFFNQNSINKTIKVIPGGAKTVDGKMIEMDNIIGLMDWTEDNFNKQVNINEVYSFINLEDRAPILNSIKYFGEQVKSFTLSKIKSGWAGAHIARREELKNTAIQQYNTAYLTLQQNASFMGQYGSILKTLGPYNVFWTTAGGRQFTSDFIHDFHQQKLKLMFEYQGLADDYKNKSANDDQNKARKRYPITNEIVLDRYIDKTGKKRLGLYKKVRWH